MADQKRKSLMRNLGQFFGHIAKGVRADPAKGLSSTQEVRREVEERHETGPAGEKIIVRRTTVEEIEIEQATRPKGPPGDQP